MSNRGVFNSICVLVYALSVAGCGGHAHGPSPSFVQQMQNEAGCLDLAKVVGRAAASKKVIAAVEDLEIRPDGKPLSEAYVRDLIHNLHEKDVEVKMKDFTEHLGVQKGCKSFVFQIPEYKTEKGELKPSRTELEVRLVLATPTRLVLDRISAVDRHNPEAFTQFGWTLVSDSELDATANTPHLFGHEDDCGGREYHQVKGRLKMLWGDAPVAPAMISPNLTALKKRAADYEDVDQTSRRKDLDAAYCSAVRASK